MSRVKRGVISRKRHKKVLKQAKGYYSARSKVFRVAKQAVIKSLQYSYRDRKCKKRIFRRNWILTINAAVRQYGYSYSKFIYNLKKFNIELNRKMLCMLIKNNNDLFKIILDKIMFIETK